MDNISVIKNRIKHKRKVSINYNKKEVKNKISYKKTFKTFIYKTLFVIFLILVISILSKKNNTFKNIVYEKVYDSYISFAMIKKYYNKYIGNVIPFEDIDLSKTVFSTDEIEYSEKNTYDNGVELTLKDNNIIPILSDGIVVFIGEKENLNKTLIIEDENKVNYIYGNLESINVKLYDYVSKGDLLGSASNKTLYLLFQKDGKYLDYNEFIK